MKKDKPIFELRFGANEKLLPSQEDLRVFLASARKAGTREPHANDLALYRRLLLDLQAFEKNHPQGVGMPDFRGKIFYGVLGQSYFVNRALLAAVEEYKYHLHALLELDFRKPAAFIKAAAEEMGKLNPKKKDDAAKLARLRGMVEERQQTVTMLRKRRAALAAELGDIAKYVRNNLAKIKKLCETSIVVLVDMHLRQKKENELIEDVKMQLEERLRDSLHQGSDSRQHLESVAEDVNLLSKELSALFREDVYAMTGLFEAIHDHANTIIRELDVLPAQAGSAEREGVEEETGPFAQIERALYSLVSECRFDLKAAEIHTQTAHEDLFLEKRKEMLAYLFALLEKERRKSGDRRAGEDRRKFNDPNRKGPERRIAKDRRSGKSRRDR